MGLADETCKAAKAERLSTEEARRLSSEVSKWSIRDGSMEKEFSFRGFKEAVSFVERIAETAEREEHHPDITIRYNKVVLTLSTHKAGGLTRKDFILAAKADRIPEEGKG